MKGPVIIAVTGAHSGVGKTLLVCRLLAEWPHWGAIKYSKSSLYSSITEDISVLSEKGKDTARYLESGAEKVLWVKSSPPNLPDALSMAVGMLSSLTGVIIEGNSAAEAIRPHLLIFICGSSEGKAKKGSGRLLEKANVIIFDDDTNACAHHRPGKAFRSSDEDSYMGYIKEEVTRLLSD